MFGFCKMWGNKKMFKENIFVMFGFIIENIT